MNVESFLAHHGIRENPFEAEEARLDPVYRRLIESATAHPDFAKILGRIDQPSTAVVFGEKGSGKTAIRMLIDQRVDQHNQQHPDQRTLLVVYDDLNPFLDRVVQRRRDEMGFNFAAKSSPEKVLESYRLEDHQDAILALTVTKLVDGLLGTSEGSGPPMLMPDGLKKRIKKWPRSLRVDVAILAALYDQPRSGAAAHRWGRLCAKLRLKPWVASHFPALLGATAGVSAAGLFLADYLMDSPPMWLMPLVGLLIAAAVVLVGLWVKRHVALWSLARKIHREVLAVHRPAHDLRTMLLELRKSDLLNVPWPVPANLLGRRGATGNQDSRYQLTNRLRAVLRQLGYTGLMVLVDRVDEPTLISGQPQRMRSIVWPMLDNKFLQQEAAGLKLLLPIELRHLLHRESAEFFQEARLDKQNMIDRLTWSGPTLYDLCTQRLRACGATQPEPLQLTDLFALDVTREMLIDALDQMHQPRDAFKFLYAIVQEHCRMSTEDQLTYKIPRLTLESVRRQQSQRVQDMYRGLTPA